MTSSPRLPPHLMPAIFDRMHEGILVTDAELDEPGPRVVYANPAFTRLTGYEAEELLGRSPRVLQGPDSDRDVLDRLRRQLELGETFEGETVNYHKDGTPFLMQWYIEPLRDGEGTITHFVAVQRDVTLERAASQQQRALEQAVRQLVDLAVLFRDDGDVRYVNQAFLDWSGVERRDVVGTPVWKLPGGPSRADLLLARRILSQGASWRRQYSVRRPDGRRRTLVVTVSPVVDQAGRGEFLAVGRDVTEKQRLEMLLEANDLHDHMGLVLAGLRHDLAEPLGSLGSTLRRLAATGDPPSPETLRDGLDACVGEVARVESLLGSLGDEWLLERSGPMPLDLPGFVERFVEEARPDLEARGIALETRIETRDAAVWIDPRTLRHVLLHLVGNAATALVDRSDGVVEIEVDRHDELGLLRVRDNGPGIAPEHLARVFEPPSESRPDDLGTGLAICRRLLSLVQGTIDVASSSRGTEVTVELELRAARSWSVG